MRVFAAVVLVLAVAGGVWWWLSGGGSRTNAELFSVNSDVERLDGASRAREFVPASERRAMAEGDGVSVDDSGRARLEMSGCVLDVFRATDLQVVGIPGLSVPACRSDIARGTIYAKVTTRTEVGTDWAVVTTSGTEFLVYVNDRIGLLWVIVADGRVEVEAQGVTVALTAGEQAWVWRDDPPMGPVPASRSEVPDVDRFPPLGELTNGVIPDDELLEPGGEPEPVGLELRPSTDALVVPECAGDKIIEVFAIVTGPDEAVAAVTNVEIAFGWDGVTVEAFGMEQIDDRTYRAEFRPNYQFDPARPDGTTLDFTVLLRGPNREVLAMQSGEASLEYCIG